jgi:selT/selW/selH-like putative selenoprotein
VRGGGGIFDITINGALVFSKKQTGTFPSDAEVKDLVT